MSEVASRRHAGPDCLTFPIGGAEVRLLTDKEVGDESVRGPAGHRDGGIHNTASGVFSSVSRGNQNTSGGPESSVSGGESNKASGELASILGGKGNTDSEKWGHFP